MSPGFMGRPDRRQDTPFAIGRRARKSRICHWTAGRRRSTLPRSEAGCPEAKQMRHAPLIVATVLLVISVRIAAQQPGGGGVPLADLTPAQRQAFNDGQRTFAKSYTMAEGLGPVFNDDSCADCHRGGG